MALPRKQASKRRGRPSRNVKGGREVAPLTDIDAKARILDAAERLFAEHGFTPTTIKHIADVASVNSALLYYYFGSKEGLYAACVGRFVAQLADTAEQRIESSASADDVIRAIVGAQASMIVRKPYLPKLLVREMVDAQAAHVVGALNDLSERMFRRLRSAIVQGQASGDYRDDLDPTFAAVSTISQVAYLAMARPLLSIVLGRGTAGIDDGELTTFAEHAGDFAIAALRRTTARSSQRASSRRPRINPHASPA
ncbi:MAG: TetR/AcrR family transcriptional regulator [Gemmatimonadaceae bacterium]